MFGQEHTTVNRFLRNTRSYRCGSMWSQHNLVSPTLSLFCFDHKAKSSQQKAPAPPLARVAGSHTWPRTLGWPLDSDLWQPRTWAAAVTWPRPRRHFPEQAMVPAPATAHLTPRCLEEKLSGSVLAAHVCSTALYHAQITTKVTSRHKHSKVDTWMHTLVFLLSVTQRNCHV